MPIGCGAKSAKSELDHFYLFPGVSMVGKNCGLSPFSPFSLYYNHISWDSDQDGPGRRVVLFLQGCDYACPWCHSPHTRSLKPTLLFAAGLCTDCGLCEHACPSGVFSFSSGVRLLQRRRCTGCGLCVSACPQSRPDRNGSALRIVPQLATVSSLFRMLKPQLALCGALTVSGGEPLLQWRAVRELLILCQRAGIQTAVETTLTAPTSAINDLLNLVDVWLVGLRPLAAQHRHLRVPDSAITARNLARLPAERVRIRYPLIPGYTDGEDSLAKVADILEGTAISCLDLLPFNENTGHYYEALGSRFRPRLTMGGCNMAEVECYFRPRGICVTANQ